MTQDHRTRSQILANFPDNTNGQISPQDLRDFVVSVMGGAAVWSFDREISTYTIGTTPTQVTWFTDLTSAYGNIVSGNGAPDYEFEISSEGDGRYEIDWRIDATGLQSGTTYTFSLRVNGLEFSRAKAQMRVADNTILAHTGFRVIRPMNAFDRITIWVEADANGQDLTPVNGFFAIRRVG